MVDELSVDVLSVNKKSVDEMSVDGLSPHQINYETWIFHKKKVKKLYKISEYYCSGRTVALHLPHHLKVKGSKIISQFKKLEQV